jgi:mRNA interferase RelE/StbE
MASYRIEWKESARKELRKLTRGTIARVLTAVDGLAEDPRSPGCRKLVGTERTYRVRIGDYRVVYSIEDDLLLVEIIRVGHRGGVYERRDR